MNHNHASSSGHANHMWLMLLCCLIPIGLILAVALFGLSLGPLTPYLPFVIVLLCPLLMFFMMRGMGHEHAVGDVHHGEKPVPQNANSPQSAPINAAMEPKSHQ